MKRTLPISVIILALLCGLAWSVGSGTETATAKASACQKIKKQLRKAVSDKRSLILKQTRLEAKGVRAHHEYVEKYAIHRKAKNTYKKFVRTHRKAILKGKPGALHRQRVLDRRVSRAYRATKDAWERREKYLGASARLQPRISDAKESVKEWNRARKRAGCR